MEALLLPQRELWDGAYGVAIANTVHAQRVDRPPLSSLDDILTWGERVHILTGAETAAIRSQSPANTDAIVASFNEIRSLAEAIVLAGRLRRQPRSHETEQLNHLFSRAMATVRVLPDSQGYRFVLNPERDALDRLAQLTILSLADLLTTGLFLRIRICQARDCDLAFVDRSRGHGRRWCDMETCGHEQKMRRLKARRRAYDRVFKQGLLSP